MESIYLDGHEEDLVERSIRPFVFVCLDHIMMQNK